jgi:hypothetical protein
MQFFGNHLEFLFIPTEAETVSVLNLSTDDEVVSFKSVREILSEMWQDDVSCILSSKWNDGHNFLNIFSCTPEGKIQASTMNGSSFSKSFCLFDQSAGHTDLVRDVIQLNDSLIVSGGEDSKICIWTT